MNWNPFRIPRGTLVLVQVPLFYAHEQAENLRTYLRMLVDNLNELARLICVVHEDSTDILPCQVRLIREMTWPVGLSFMAHPMHLLLHGGAVGLINLLADRAAVFQRTEKLDVVVDEQQLYKGASVIVSRLPAAGGSVYGGVVVAGGRWVGWIPSSRRTYSLM